MSADKRSRIMSHIRGKNTKPELMVRKYLFSRGLRYRVNVRKLPGTPDIVLRKYKTVVFVNGCFWHHHDCAAFHWPKSNVEFWTEKITRNEQRDARNHRELADAGWNVVTVWECELKKSVLEDTLQRVYRTIVGEN
ncbi:very short patch repair endonuclease [Bifidobacterium gallicum]|uniref:very short patch repair endonuclease n=1 Tax=Bifidobacterium gallicum TaxID=78342 RepID=UPI0023A934BA|nr:very short patch repair endonuclease [Bifidobacterium gallicum]